MISGLVVVSLKYAARFYSIKLAFELMLAIERDIKREIRWRKIYLVSYCVKIFFFFFSNVEFSNERIEWKLNFEIYKNYKFYYEMMGEGGRAIVRLG